MLDIEIDSIMYNYLCNYICICLKIFSQECLIIFVWLNEIVEIIGKVLGYGYLFKYLFEFLT